MPLDADAVASVERRLAAAGVTRDEAIAVVHVSASSPFRRWPMPAFIDDGRRARVAPASTRRS